MRISNPFSTRAAYAGAGIVAAAGLVFGISGADANPTAGVTGVTTPVRYAAPAPSASGTTTPSAPELQQTQETQETQDQVAAAVTTQHPEVTVLAVREDADGSYDVLGSAAGTTELLHVSADLATVTVVAGGSDDSGSGDSGSGAASPSDDGSTVTV